MLQKQQRKQMEVSRQESFSFLKDMDAVKTFFASNKTQFPNSKQLSGFPGPTNNGSSHIGGGNSDTKVVHDIKRKDSDSYFYIMWRS